MQKMSFKERLLGLTKLLSISLYNLSRYWRDTGFKPSEDIHENYPDLAAEHRRRERRAGLERQTEDIWNAHYEPPRVGELLQQYTLRTKKDEGVQEEARKRSERNSRLAGFSATRQYKEIVVEFFKMIEVDAYWRLRHPEERIKSDDPGDRANSIEWYNGKQAGRLEIVEDFRLMISSALLEIQTEKAREKLKEKQKNETTKKS